MTIKEGFRAEISPMVRLALPLVFAEIGWMAMGVEDTMFVGRVSAQAIGAVGLGTMLFYAIGIFAGGLLLGLDTLVSQSFGAGDRDDCRHSLISGVWLSLLLTPVVMGLIRGLMPLLAKLNIDPAVMAVTLPYMRVLNWGVPSLLLFFGFRRYLQSINIVRPVMITLLTANVVNIVCNWAFVFGNLGAPRLGAEGSAWATFVSRAYMAAVLGAVIWRNDPGLPHVTWKPDFQRVKALLRLGMPAAGQIGLETGVFAVVTVLIGKLGADALAGNQIALMTVSTTFMMPLGISSAAAVRVGHAIGRGDSEGMARAGWTALGLGGAVMSCAAVALLIFPYWIARLFTPEAQVIAAGMVLLRVAAFFQLFDGLQVVATGALRGAGDTRTPMICHFTGYWVIGLPLGALLCFRFGMGAPGLWIGLSAGLIAIGVVLVEVWRRKESGVGRQESE
ncbi:MAG: MATE family efflux transporter [Bryobacteraceae bacterium]